MSLKNCFQKSSFTRTIQKVADHSHQLSRRKSLLYFFLMIDHQNVTDGKEFNLYVNIIQKVRTRSMKVKKSKFRKDLIFSYEERITTTTHQMKIHRRTNHSVLMLINFDENIRVIGDEQ